MKYLSVFLKSLWLNIGGILSVVAIYYLLIVIDQGVDVVIQAGENLSPAICTIAGCILWAVILWYSGRMLSYIKQQKRYDKNPVDMNTVDAQQKALIMYTTRLQKHMPRLIAFNCFVCLQAAIISLPTATPTLDGWGLMLFILGHNAFYLLLNASVKAETHRCRCDYAAVQHFHYHFYIKMGRGRCSSGNQQAYLLAVLLYADLLPAGMHCCCVLHKKEGTHRQG
jgi:hypothetical protein